jgi:hypothetical protein
VTPGSPVKASPKDFWNKTFGRYSDEQKEHDRDNKKKQRGNATERSGQNLFRRKRSTALVMMSSGLRIGLAVRFMS